MSTVSFLTNRHSVCLALSYSAVVFFQQCLLSFGRFVNELHRNPCTLNGKITLLLYNICFHFISQGFTLIETNLKYLPKADDE